MPTAKQTDWRSAAFRAAAGAAAAALVMAGGAAVLAALIVSGRAGEELGEALTAPLCLLAGAAGGLVSAGLHGHRKLPAALLPALVICVLRLAVSAVFGQVPDGGHLTSSLALILGGLLSGFVGRKGRRRRH